VAGFCAYQCESDLQCANGFECMGGSRAPREGSADDSSHKSYSLEVVWPDEGSAIVTLFSGEIRADDAKLNAHPPPPAHFPGCTASAR
jgi:hypothetical protein